MLFIAHLIQTFVICAGCPVPLELLLDSNTTQFTCFICLNNSRINETGHVMVCTTEGSLLSMQCAAVEVLCSLLR